MSFGKELVRVLAGDYLDDDDFERRDAWLSRIESFLFGTTFGILIGAVLAVLS